jgi:hypothetical protein
MCGGTHTSVARTCGGVPFVHLASGVSAQRGDHDVQVGNWRAVEPKTHLGGTRDRVPRSRRPLVVMVGWCKILGRVHLHDRSTIGARRGPRRMPHATPKPRTGGLKRRQTGPRPLCPDVPIKAFGPWSVRELALIHAQSSDGPPQPRIGSMARLHGHDAPRASGAPSAGRKRSGREQNASPRSPCSILKS